MITQIELENYKCFEIAKIPTKQLTLLTGSNASGKSSVIQALALLQQTIQGHEWSTRLILNGDSIKLGTVSDVVDKVHGRKSIAIGLEDEDMKYRWVFSGERADMSMGVDSISVGKEITTSPNTLQHLFKPPHDVHTQSMASLLKDLTYITAERIGPRDFYPLEDSQIKNVVGPSGEYATSLLYLGRDQDVLPNLRMEGIPPTRLRQVEAYMATFFPNCGLEISEVPQVNSVRLGFRTSDDTDFHRPINVGFGLTQVFPILVAALSAKKGDIILIENPEVHLHPAGQSFMGQFLSNVAHAGVQIVIETHSDHILNGVRRAVKNKQLTSEQVAIHYFRPRAENGPQITSPQIDDSGNIDHWPDGFFDQFDKDMNHFANWG